MAFLSLCSEDAYIVLVLLLVVSLLHSRSSALLGVEAAVAVRSIAYSLALPI